MPRYDLRRSAISVVVGLLVAAMLTAAVPAMAGPATGAAVTFALLAPTTAVCLLSTGPDALFTGFACGAGWVLMGLGWLLPL